MDKLKLVIIVLCLLFWPLSLFLANTTGDFIKYLIPAFLVGFSIFLIANKKNSFYFLPILAIPLVEPKLTAFPLVTLAIVFLLEKNRKNLLFVLLSLLILIFSWKNFWGQTIFQIDYQAHQEVIGKTYLYPTVVMARIFQNKPRIYLNKFNSNLFALIDPNNYFFNFHPREILIDNQNLNKYPFLSIIFMLFGLYYLRKHVQWKFLLLILGSMLFSLSILNIFDRNDFVLWLPMSLVIIHGIKIFHKNHKVIAPIYFALFLIFAILELIRIFLQ